jgi:hypothetical protein
MRGDDGVELLAPSLASGPFQDGGDGLIAPGSAHGPLPTGASMTDARQMVPRQGLETLPIVMA